MKTSNERLEDTLAVVRKLLTGDVSVGIQPKHDYVLVKRMPNPTESEGGILLPEKQQSAKARLKVGVVLAVGPGRWHPVRGHRIPVGVDPGDTVYYWPFMAEPVTGHGTGDDALSDLFVVPGLPSDLKDRRPDNKQGVERAGIVAVIKGST